MRLLVIFMIKFLKKRIKNKWMLIILPFSIFSNKGLNMACHILWVVGRN